MIAVNTALSVVSIGMALLFARAFLPWIPLRGFGRRDVCMAWAVVLASVGYVPFASYHDLLILLRGGGAIEVGFGIYKSLFVILSAYLTLRARYLSIPEGERSRFNWFWAVWYPKQLRIMR